jgi:hypothetical protein
MKPVSLPSGESHRSGILERVVTFDGCHLIFYLCKLAAESIFPDFLDAMN